MAIRIDRRGVLAAAGALVAGVAGPARASPRPARLEGLWSMGSYTDLERPADAPRLVLTAAEAQAFEARRHALHGMLPGQAGEVGQAENEYIDRGEHLARVKGQIRSSWIVDPPDGRIPYRPDVFARLDKHRDPSGRRFDDPEQLAGPERCVASISAGAPLLGAPDANLIQIVETADCVAIVCEKYHDVRVVRLAAGPPSGRPESWLGDSVGRWEGPTLCVETLGLRPGVTHRGQRIYVSGDTRTDERFTRAGPGELLYEFTVEDPSLYTRPWRGEITFTAAAGRMFEYTCHEGNYSIVGILAGARREEREARR